MRFWGGLVVAAAFVGLPWILTGPFYERMGALVLLYAISASAWNLVGGYAGQISVGHAVFFGTGAYTALFVFNQWELPPVTGIRWSETRQFMEASCVRVIHSWRVRFSSTSCSWRAAAVAAAIPPDRGLRIPLPAISHRAINHRPVLPR